MTASPTDDLASAERRIQELTKDLSEARGELAEAREQQAATAQILAAISRSPTDAKAVFSEIAASAARLCDAYDSGIALVAHDHLQIIAVYGPIPWAGERLPLSRSVVVGHAVLDRRTIHVADLQSETLAYPEGCKLARQLGHRTVLVVPLMRSGDAIGVVVIRRKEVRPFTDRQIDLLKTFADQAVIAIENTRLFEAEQTRTRELTERTQELTETLDYQTATSDVLNVISRSPSNLQPVLDAIVTTAVRLCQAEFADFRLLRDGLYRIAATTEDEAVHITRHNPIAPGRGSVVGRAALERRTVHVPDAEVDPEYTYVRRPYSSPARGTLLGVPLVRDGIAVGVIVLVNRTVRPFTQKQIALVTTFADQALIAIENTRLFEAEQASKR